MALGTYSNSDNEQLLFGWGFGFYYQLGKGHHDNEDHLEPTEIVMGNTNKYAKHKSVVYISCGYFNSAAIIALVKPKKIEYVMSDKGL